MTLESLGFPDVIGFLFAADGEGIFQLALFHKAKRNSTKGAIFAF